MRGKSRCRDAEHLALHLEDNLQHLTETSNVPPAPDALSFGSAAFIPEPVSKIDVVKDGKIIDARVVPRNRTL